MSEPTNQAEGSDEETGQGIDGASDNNVTPGATAPNAPEIGVGPANMSLIMDIPVTVSMELGRTRLSSKELLSMNPGTVIELQRLASEPMEILVNGTLVAHGEAVRVGERYGVRLTSVIAAGERLEKMGGL